MAEMTLGDFRDRTDGLPDSTILRIDAGGVTPREHIVILADTSEARRMRGYVIFQGKDGNNIEPCGVSDYADGVVRIEL